MKHSNFSRVLSLVLALVMVFSMLPATAFASDSATATLVTDVSALAAGDRIVIVAAEYDYALSTNQKTNNRGAAAVTKTDSTVTLDDTVQILTLEAGTVDGTFAFNTGSGYLYAAGQSKAQNGSKNNNHLKTQTELDANGSWLITVTDGVASIVAQGDNGCNVLQYNSGSTLFSAYSSASQASVALYKLAEESSTDPSEPTDPTDPEPEDPTAAYIADGDYVIWEATQSKAASALASEKSYGYLTTADVVLTDGVLSGYGDTELWTIANQEDGTFTITDAYGRYLYMSGTYNSFNVAEAPTEGHLWCLERTAEGALHLKNVLKEKTVAYDTQYSSFGAYPELNETRLAGLTFTRIYDDPISDDMIEEGVLDLAEANAAAAENVTVIGQVVYHYGKPYNGSESLNSIILEDVINNEIVGFQIYDYTNYANYKVGDIVKVTGSITSYNGVMQMSFPAMEVVQTDLEPIPAQEVTVSQLGAAYLSEYVYIKDVTLGTYNANNTTVTDATGTTNLYCGAPLPAGITEADVTALYGCCSAYKTTYQLRNGTAADYVSAAVESSGLPAEGDQVVIYNLSAQGVLGAESDTQSINNVLTAVEGGIATPENGGVVFTVSKNDSYYRFYNETYGYLCSNGTGNNAFYSLEASEDADWTLTSGKSGGFNMESRTAKYNGTYSQYLEYYADSYKTYSMYNVTDYDIYEFFFYGVAEGVNLSGGIVNAPAVDFGTLADAYVGQDYTFSVAVDAVFGVDTMTVKAGETVLTANEDGTYTITAELIAGERLTITVEGTDTLGVAFSGTAEVKIIDEPSIANATPAANSQTLDNKRPVISAEIVNAGENAVVSMNINGEAVEAVYENGTVTYTPAADMADGRVTVTVTVTRADGKTAELSWSFTVGEKQFELYFGQLHSHTTYSDGSGSLESALEYIAGLPESANVDFVAFTDHSNYFDTTSSANPEGALYDMSLASASSQELWNAYKGAIADFNASQSDVVAIGGFEMTWSGGPGHINTFATPGIVSRNNTTLNNKTSDAGMKAYYALLSQIEGTDSISQFNHPGTTFGNFTDFAYWDAVIDSRIQLVEVGNGEGQVGAGGYYPSYEQYTMALDKGWHVAPTNNQDNHKGKWGNANDARDVVLTDDFSEEGIYEAIRAYRVYATEDKNLQLGYTVNGFVLGSVIEEVPEVLNVEVTAYDPDGSDSISKVEVIVNSGKVAHTWDDPAALATGVLTAELAPEYSYYYIRVTQGDGDIAVTAPVWVGETLKLGISAVECGTSTPVTGEELTITTTLFNSELTDAAVKSVTYTVGSQVLGVDNTGYTIPASGNLPVAFQYTPDAARVMKLTVTAVVELDGVEYTFSMDVELDVQDASKLVYIGIDASHYNEYVNGNYKDSMGNFSALAAGYSVRTVQLNTSEDLIAACSNEKYAALILTAPSRRLAAAQEALLTYTEAELAAIKAFNENGGAVILANWSDHYENYPSVDSVANMAPEQHMAATQNAVLEALGSSLRMGDDATYDDSYNGGQAYRLYFNSYNFDSFLVDGVEVDPANPHDRLYTEVFSYYGGSTIYTVDGTIPETVTPVVYGHATTYSVDVDGDGLGGDSVPKYAYTEGDDRLLALATEQIGDHGLIVVSGAAFMSNFEVQATIEDSGSEKNYSNYRICENLVQYLNPVTVTDIADVQAEENEGVKYTIEGIVTSNASGYDKDTAFFDCIYLQDATAGINAFPVAGSYKIGDKVRITGTTSSYQGERQIAVTKIELISEGNEVTPTQITAAELNDGSRLGSLVTLSGTVESFEYANGLVQTIMVKDAAGNVGRVFIDGYITTSYDVENLEAGSGITVTGLASYDNSFDGPAPRIRVRDRHDVVCEKHAHIEEILPAVEPTFDATGLTEGKKCAVCGEILVAQEVLPMLDYNAGIVPIPVLTATAGDSYGSDAPANVLDDDFATMWHTNWYGTSRDNHWIQFELSDDYIVNGLRYKPRTDLNRQNELQLNGTIIEYRIQVSNDGVTFEDVASGEWEANSDWKVAAFDGRNVKYVRLVAVNACTDNTYVFASAAEIRLTGEKGDHVYETVVTAPTCTEEGYTTYTCKCGDSYTADVVPALGHDWHGTGCSRCDAVRGNPYEDVSEEHWFFEPALALYYEGIMIGKDATHFDPDGTLTRAEWVTLLYRTAGSPEVAEPSTFTDVPADAFFADAFAWAEDEGIINGVSENLGAPYMTITREQMVTMLYRFDGQNKTEFDLSGYADVDDVSYYAIASFEWAVANGHINGMSAAILAPQATANRAQAATILARYLGLI